MTLPIDIPEDIADRAAILMDELRHIEDDLEYTARIIMALGQGPSVASGLTERQRDVLSFVTSFVSQHGGVSPAVREISAGLGCTLSRAHSVLKQLQKKGFITMTPYSARSISIVGRAA